MAATVPANRRSITQDKFTWTIPGSRKKVSLRSAAYLSLRQARAFADAGKKGSGGTLLLDLAYSPEDRETVDNLPAIILKQLLGAWQKDGKETLGK